MSSSEDDVPRSIKQAIALRISAVVAICMLLTAAWFYSTH